MYKQVGDKETVFLIVVEGKLINAEIIVKLEKSPLS